MPDVGSLFRPVRTLRHVWEALMTAARKPLDRSNPEDRSTISRLGGYARWANTTPEERSRIGQQRGAEVLAKKGRAHFLRMSLISHGRLPKVEKS